MDVGDSVNLVNIQINSNTIAGVSFPVGSTIKVGYVNGKKEGEGLVFSMKKTKLARLSFHEDVLDGLCIFFDSDGVKIKECMFDKGVQNGWGREFKSGKAVTEGIFRNTELYSELKVFSKDKRFMEEIKGEQTLSVCRYDEYHKRFGLGYLFKNGVMHCEMEYANGIEKRELKKFHNELMLEYDDTHQIIYKGEYCGSISEGFKRTGKGEELVYSNGTVREVVRLVNGIIQGKCVLHGKEMDEYEGARKVYEGEFCFKDNHMMRNGNGVVFCSRTHYYMALFVDGIEKRKVNEIIEDVLIDYDDQGRVVYKGGYKRKENTYTRKGKGQLFEYNNGALIEVYSSEDGMKTIKSIEFEYKVMIELNENGGILYKGEYKGSPRDGYHRHGEGDEYDINDMLVYSGHWKEGCREGSGRYYQNGDLRYNGEWKNGKPNGNGTVFNNEGEAILEGQWKDGFHQRTPGVMIDYKDVKPYGLYESGERKYDGEWKNGKPHGKGRYLSKEGKVLYEGEWKNGMIEIEKEKWFEYESGMTCLKNGESVVYRGQIMNGIPDGQGSVISPEGYELFKGEWENGVLRISVFQFVEIEDGNVYVNETQPSGLFGCSHSLKRVLLNDIKGENMEIIKKERQWESLSLFITSLTVSEQSCNELRCDLRICCYPCLQSISVRKNSLMNLNSLTISNNPQLTVIITEDGESMNKVFSNVKTVDIENKTINT